MEKERKAKEPARIEKSVAVGWKMRSLARAKMGGIETYAEYQAATVYVTAEIGKMKGIG